MTRVDQSQTGANEALKRNYLALDNEYKLAIKKFRIHASLTLFQHSVASESNEGFDQPININGSESS